MVVIKHTQKGRIGPTAQLHGQHASGATSDKGLHKAEQLTYHSLPQADCECVASFRRTLDGMSQLLMARMQQEMKSLEELGGEVIEELPSSDGSRTPLLSHDQPHKGAAKGADEEDTRQYDSSLQAAMRLVATLTAQLNTAREKALGQRAALLSTLARLRGKPQDNVTAVIATARKQ